MISWFFLIICRQYLSLEEFNWMKKFHQMQISQHHQKFLCSMQIFILFIYGEYNFYSPLFAPKRIVYVCCPFATLYKQQAEWGPCERDGKTWNEIIKLNIILISSNRAISVDDKLPLRHIKNCFRWQFYYRNGPEGWQNFSIFWWFII